MSISCFLHNPGPMASCESSEEALPIFWVVNCSVGSMAIVTVPSIRHYFYLQHPDDALSLITCGFFTFFGAMTPVRWTAEVEKSWEGELEELQSLRLTLTYQGSKRSARKVGTEILMSLLHVGRTSWGLTRRLLPFPPTDPSLPSLPSRGQSSMQTLLSR